MVLFGQPELDEKLRNNSIRQLKERITHNFYLDPFPSHDVYNYLNFRMRAVGYHGPDLFSPKMANNIERKSNGLTRRINILADKALLAAFSDGGHDITSKHISLAAKDSDFGQGIRWQPAVKILIASGVILASIWVGTMLPQLMPNKNFPISKTVLNNTSRINTPSINSPIVNSPALKASTEKNKTLAPIQTPSNLNPNNILNLRLQETALWIQNAADENFTIQLTLLDSNLKNDAQRFLKKIKPELNLQNIYIYKVSIRGRMFYSVLYNMYTERNQAVKQLQQLPNRLKKNGPFLRTIRGIKADIEKTSQQGTSK